MALKFISVELLSGIRAHELIVLQEFFRNQKSKLSYGEIRNLFEAFDMPYTEDDLESTIKVLDLSFYESVQRRNYMPAQMFISNELDLVASDKLKEFYQNNYFNQLAIDAIQTGIEKNKHYHSKEPLNLYKKYRRKDALRVLNMDFKQNEQGIGGYTFSNNQFAIFVTLDKGKDFNASLMAYEDEFLDESTFRWFTKSPRTLDSPEVELLKNASDWHIHLFIKRKYSKKDNEIDFYYLGEMSPIKESIHQKQKPTSDGKVKNVVEMDFTLLNPVETNMYEFLTNTVD